MPKYYVQSGSIRGIVDCHDAECAAVWAVHRVMQRIENKDENPPIIASCPEDTKGDGMAMLGETIRVHEAGFDHDDCETVDTFDAFIQWHELTRAIESLTEKLDEHNDDML